MDRPHPSRNRGFAPSHLQERGRLHWASDDERRGHRRKSLAEKVAHNLGAIALLREMQQDQMTNRAARGEQASCLDRLFV